LKEVFGRLLTLRRSEIDHRVLSAIRRLDEEHDHPTVKSVVKFAAAKTQNPVA
jgi:hypothetical protein